MFRKFISALIIVLGFAVAAEADPGSASKAVIEVDIALEPTAEGLRASYGFSAPVTEFTFDNSEVGDGEEQAIPIRRENWRITDTGFTFDGLTLKRTDGTSFQNFTLFARPDSRDYDRVYVALFRMGDAAYGLYSRHFIGDKEQFTSSFCRVGPVGCDPAPYNALDPADVAGGTFMAVGNIPTTDLGDMTLLVSPLLDEKVAASIRRSLVKSTANFAQMFGYPAPENSRIFLSYDANSSGYRGGVADGAAMFVQLRGPMANGDSDAIAQVEDFIAHEVVHYWNGSIFDSIDNANQSWLHEGGASYFAAAATGREAELYQRATDWLNNCQRAPKDKPLNGSGGAVTGQAPYSCGALVHWLLDLELKKTSGGAQGVGDVWRNMFSVADAAEGRKYSAAMFQEAVLLAQKDSDIWGIVAPILDETGEARWAGLANVLKNHGFAMRPKKLEDFNSFDILGPAIFVFLNAECGPGSRGFYHNSDHLKLDTGSDCGVMSGDPVVRTIDGISLLGEPARVFRHLQEACRQKANVVFADPASGTSFTVTCKAPPPSLPDQYLLSPIAADQ